MFHLLQTWSAHLITVMACSCLSGSGNSAMLLWVFLFYLQLSWSYFFLPPTLPGERWHWQLLQALLSSHQRSSPRLCSCFNILQLFPCKTFSLLVCSSSGCSVASPPCWLQGGCRAAEFLTHLLATPGANPPDFPALWAGLNDAKACSGSLGHEPLGSTAGLSLGALVSSRSSPAWSGPQEVGGTICGCPSPPLGCSVTFGLILPVWPFHGGLMLIHTKLLTAGKWHLSVHLSLGGCGLSSLRLCAVTGRCLAHQPQAHPPCLSPFQFCHRSQRSGAENNINPEMF